MPTVCGSPTRGPPHACADPRHLLDLRLAPDADRAEGIALHPKPDRGQRLLVAYDSPAEARPGTVEGAVLLDLFALPGG